MSRCRHCRKCLTISFLPIQTCKIKKANSLCKTLTIASVFPFFYDSAHELAHAFIVINLTLRTPFMCCLTGTNRPGSFEKSIGFLKFAIIIVPAFVGSLYSRGGMHSEDVPSRCKVIRILVPSQCYYNAQISGILAVT